MPRDLTNLTLGFRVGQSVRIGDEVEVKPEPAIESSRSNP